MKKTWIIYIFTFSLFALLLSGCSNPDISSENDSSEEPYTMTMVLTGPRQRDEARIEEKINEILLPALNMKLDIEMLPWESQSQQLRLMLAGDERIDCFYTGAAAALRYMKNGQIVDLTELIDTCGANLKAIFGEEDLSGLSVNGFTFGVPAHCEGVSVPAVFLRRDLVEKYGIDVSKIKKPEDLDGVFAKVYAGEPDMTMLFSNGSSNGPLYRLGLSAYDPLGDGAGVLMDPVNSTTVVNLYETDWYYDTASLLYDWYQKGYISPDAATENESWDEVLGTGKVFAMITGDHPGILAELESSTGYEFVAADFGGQGIKKSNYYSDIIYCIAQNSEDPRKAMECLDYIYGSPEIMNLLNWGEEEVDYVFTDRGDRLITFPEGVTLDTVGYSLNLGWELPNQYLVHLWEGSDPKVYEELQKINAQGLKSQAFGFHFDSTGLDVQEAAVSTVFYQYASSISSGTVDPGEYIPRFVRDLKKAGIHDIIQAKQEQLDDWLAEKEK